MRIVPNDAVLIPDFAKKVFSGQIFDVYQWPQVLFDGSTATFEMLRRPDTVLFLCIKDGRLILVDEAQPGRQRHMRIPGGRVDPGEEWLKAAQRECSEELGLSFQNWKLLTVRQPIAKIEWFVAVYLATEITDEHQPHIDAGEQITIVEHSFEQLQAWFETAQDPEAAHLRELLSGLTGLEELKNAPAFQGKQIKD